MQLQDGAQPGEIGLIQGETGFLFRCRLVFVRGHDGGWDGHGAAGLRDEPIVVAALDGEA